MSLRAVAHDQQHRLRNTVTNGAHGTYQDPDSLAGPKHGHADQDPSICRDLQLAPEGVAFGGSERLAKGQGVDGVVDDSQLTAWDPPTRIVPCDRVGDRDDAIR